MAALLDINRIGPLPQVVEHEESIEESAEKKFKNKIVEVNAWPQEWVLNLMNQVLSTHKVDLSNSPVETEGDYIELFAQTMDPLIQEVYILFIPFRQFINTFT